MLQPATLIFFSTIFKKRNMHSLKSDTWIEVNNVFEWRWAYDLRAKNSRMRSRYTWPTHRLRQLWGWHSLPHRQHLLEPPTPLLFFFFLRFYGGWQPILPRLVTLKRNVITLILGCRASLKRRDLNPHIRQTAVASLVGYPLSSGAYCLFYSYFSATIFCTEPPSLFNMVCTLS